MRRSVRRSERSEKLLTHLYWLCGPWIHQRTSLRKPRKQQRTKACRTSRIGKTKISFTCTELKRQIRCIDTSFSMLRRFGNVLARCSPSNLLIYWSPHRLYTLKREQRWLSKSSFSRGQLINQLSVKSILHASFDEVVVLHQKSMRTTRVSVPLFIGLLHEQTLPRKWVYFSTRDLNLLASL